jgi:hypothetical protein
MSAPKDRPRQPSRTRLVRPDLYRDAVTGSLLGAVRDAYLGLATLADDAGLLLFDPPSMAAALYPYLSAGRRARDLERHVATLEAADLLRRLPCGSCAVLPRAERDLVVKGGTPLRQVLEWHQAGHPESAPEDYVAVRINSGRDSSSSSLSGSSSSSGSDSGSASDSGHRARDDGRPAHNGGSLIFDEGTTEERRAAIAREILADPGQPPSARIQAQQFLESVAS